MHRFSQIREFAPILCLLVVSFSACGWAEADTVPAQREATTGADSAGVDSGPPDGETSEDPSDFETVTHPFEAEFDRRETGDDSEAGAGSEQPPEEWEESNSDLCTETCLRATWCRDDAIDDEVMAECVESCEFTLEEKFVDESAVECVAGADNCGETRECYSEFQACDDVCQWHDNCPGHDDRGECVEWCAGEIWHGELQWDAYGCLIDTVEDACPAFGLCGVTPPEE